MQDQPADQSVTPSIDAYQPPADPSQAQPADDQASLYTPPTAAQPADVAEPDSVNQSQPPANPVPSNMPFDDTTDVVSSGAAAVNTPSESLDDQNIFFMLDADDGTEEQKNQFLDELQQVIWEDFLENDTKLLLTNDEMMQLQDLTGGDFSKPILEQEAAVEFLEKLIPDLEDLMLEKALQLKGDLFRERITSLRELYADNPEQLGAVEQANSLMEQDQWFSATQTLNAMTAAS